MKYAIIKTGGKQYKVEEGQILEVERLPQKANDAFSFGDVLLCVLDGTPKIGTPFLSSVSVKAKIVDNIKGEKIRVSKFKSKVRYRKTMGHRQLLSRIRIEKILIS